MSTWITATFLIAILFTLVSHIQSCSLYVNSTSSLDPDLTCKNDTDCVLVNCADGLGCCYAGSCDSVDYSNSTWISINTHWYSNMHNSSCPNLNTCGPAPTCSQTIVATYYVYSAACGVGQFCIKNATLPKGYLAGIVVGTIIGIGVVAFGVMVLGAMLYKAWTSRHITEYTEEVPLPARNPKGQIPLEE